MGVKLLRHDSWMAGMSNALNLGFLRHEANMSGGNTNPIVTFDKNPKNTLKRSRKASFFILF